MQNHSKAKSHVCLITCVIFLSAISQIQGQTTFNGRAIGVRADVSAVGAVTVTTVASDTGNLPSSGGSLQANVANASVDLLALGITNALNTGIIETATSGGTAGGTPNSAQSTARVNGTNASLTGIPVTATVLQSNSTCTCGSGCSGSTVITDLRVNNLAVAVTGAPNQIVEVTTLSGTVVRVIINEQTSPLPGTTDITVNALRIVLLDNIVTQVPLADIVIASSQSSVACLAPTAANISVGGRITDSSGRAIPRATVTLADSRGESRSVIANSFGYYIFDGLTPGESYFIRAVHKQYLLAEKIFCAVDDSENLHFSLSHQQTKLTNKK